MMMIIKSNSTTLSKCSSDSMIAPIEHQFMGLIQALAPTEKKGDTDEPTCEAAKVTENHDECDMDLHGSLNGFKSTSYANHERREEHLSHPLTENSSLIHSQTSLGS